ncbi:MAG TPA: ribosome biogenesis GTPase YlqF [Firmicutes bacterium]|nr:ribosome biogenesis GTPase YlqF [Bacillota bacterium]
MDIQWYPGHMAKARRQIQEHLKFIDVVVELTDARIPRSARNPDIIEIHRKPRILAVTKCDLADPARTAIWCQHWQRQQEKVVLLELTNGKGINVLRKEIRKCLTKQKREPRVLVVGIPNVGKSTLINRLAGRSSAKVGAKPGVTRGKQWINAQGFRLLDTPGLLWPKLEDQETARKLAVVAAIKDEIFDSEEITYWLLRFLQDNYPHLLVRRYDLEDPAAEISAIFSLIGYQRGCLLAKGEIDRLQTAQLILKDFRQGLIGPITLELPQRNDQNEGS